jgi:PAS domain S-box-containing protein
MKHHRDFFEYTGNAVAVVDRNYLIVGANCEFERLSGYKRRELEGKVPWTAFIRPEDREEILKIHRHCEQNPEHRPGGYEIDFFPKSGTSFPAMVSLNRINNTKLSIVSVIDISEHRRREEQMEYRLRLEKLIAGLSQQFISATRQEPDTILDLSLARTGQFMEVDRSYLFQFSEDGNRMSNTHEWCAPGISSQIELLQDLRVDEFKWIVEELRKGRNINLFSLDQLPPEAAPEKHILELQEIKSLAIVPLIHTGVLKGFMGFDAVKRQVHWREEDFLLLRTVGDIIVGEIMRRRLERQLFTSQKMDAVGRLAGGIAHDFNNILTTIRGNAQLLDYTEKLHGEDRETLKAIINATNSGADLTQRLLAFSKNQAIEAEPVHLHEILNSSEKIFSRLISRNIDLRIHLDAQNDLLRATSSQLEQIIMNLVINSVDAMPDGGTLTITTRELDAEKILLIQESKLSGGKYIHLQVSDTGMGMDSRTMEKALEPFFTTKEPGRGNGLGLSTVFNIVEHYGGSLQINSTPGRGTTINIYLPQLPSENL